MPGRKSPPPSPPNHSASFSSSPSPTPNPASCRNKKKKITSLCPSPQDFTHAISHADQPRFVAHSASISRPSSSPKLRARHARRTGIFTFFDRWVHTHATPAPPVNLATLFFTYTKEKIVVFLRTTRYLTPLNPFFFSSPMAYFTINFSSWSS